MKVKYKKIISEIAFWVATICISYIWLVQINTDIVMWEVTSAFYCRNHFVEGSAYEKYPSKFPGIDYIMYPKNSDIPNVYAHFNHTANGIFIAETTEVRTRLWLRRIFTWHNFQKGTMWIKYSVEVIDKTGEIITGSWHIPVKMEIEKIDGFWVVTDIDEAL